MSIKFDATAANQYLSMVDSAGLTYPATAFCIAWVMSFDSQSPVQTQYILSNGPYQSAGSINIGHLTGGANFMVVYGQSDLGTSSNAYSSGIRLFVLQRTVVGGVSQMTLRSSPILASAPSTAASVVVDMAPFNFGGTTFDGSGGMVIGGRSDLNTGRFCNQSLGRMFRYDGTLTDLEVAKLAYGMEITDLGYTPAWYVKMETATDITDRGSLANTVTPHGAFVTGTVPAFGYTGTTSAPAITSVPVVVGGASVGSASSVTPGTTTGNPTPTNTFQWNLNGVAVSGATGTTYTPVSGDVGKTLTVTQTATNGVGSPATSTSAGVVVAAASSTVDVAQMIAEKVNQRTNTTAALSMSGTYTNTVPTSIEYQLYAADGVTILVPWTAIAGVTIGGGNWSGTPSIPIGGPYRNSVRSKSGSTVLATSNIKANLFLVGGDFYAVGSSSANRWFLNNSGSGFTPNANVRQASSSGWSLFGTDGCAIRMANGLSTQGNMPYGMINCGVEGETLANWLNMSGTSWTNFANTLASNGGKMECLGMAMGSNDAAQGIVVSRAQHAANLRQFISNVRTITGQPNLPVVISGFNGRPGATAQQADFVRMAENDVGNDANVYSVQLVDLPLSSDSIHLTPAGFTTSGDRISYVLGGGMYGGVYHRGPKETAITYTSSLIKVTLQQRNGTDFTPTTGIGGYVFTDDSGALPLTSVVRSSATEITITPSRAIVGVPVGTYLSGSGQAPSSSVMDNGTVPLPMNVETALVATAAGSSTVTSVTVTPTNVTVQGGGTVDFDWVVNGTGNPSQAATPTTNLGSINSAGVLTAPAATSVVQNGTVTVTSAQDPTKSGTAKFSVPAQGTRTITITFGNAEGAYANQTGLSVSFHNETLPHLTSTAVFQSGTETTDANGTMTFSFASTRNVGDMGLLTVYGPNGIHYDGPWALS